MEASNPAWSLDREETEIWLTTASELSLKGSKSMLLLFNFPLDKTKQEAGYLETLAIREVYSSDNHKLLSVLRCYSKLLLIHVTDW